MSKFVPVESVPKRPKRASRACDHCRWKRLKCSDEQKEQSCMNCVIYGVKCQYTPPYSPGGTRKKGELTVIGRPGSSGPKKRSAASKDRTSQSPGALESNQDSPTSSYTDEIIYPGHAGNVMMPKFANARRLATDYAKATNPGIDLDQLSQRLDQYAAYLTSFSESHSSPVEILSKDTGLPPQAIANALLQAYNEGFQAGQLTARNWRPPHLTTNNRRSRSMHEFTLSPTAEHAMSPMSLDPLSVAAHHLASGASSPHHSSSPHPHHPGMNYADPSGAMSGLGIDATHHDYRLPVHHGHPQAVPSNVRGALGDDPRGAPRSVPHGLTLAIPSSQQWASAQNVAGPSAGMQLPHGYGQDQSHGGFY